MTLYSHNTHFKRYQLHSIETTKIIIKAVVIMRSLIYIITKVFVINLTSAFLFGLNMQRGKECVSSNCRSVLMHASKYMCFNLSYAEFRVTIFHSLSSPRRVLYSTRSAAAAVICF